MACRSGENVLCRVWLNMGDLACLVTASYNGLQIACGRVGATVMPKCTAAAVVVVDVIMPDVVTTLEEALPESDGVGGAGGVGTDCCKKVCILLELRGGTYVLVTKR